MNSIKAKFYSVSRLFKDIKLSFAFANNTTMCVRRLED